MGTNYFLRLDYCDKCLRCKEEDELHIGKLSFGWKFLFHSLNTPIKIDSYKKWKEFITNSDGIIIDECGKIITKEEFFNIIERVQKDTSTKSYYAEFFDEEGYRFDAYYFR